MLNTMFEQRKLIPQPILSLVIGGLLLLCLMACDCEDCPVDSDPIQDDHGTNWTLQPSQAPNNLHAVASSATRQIAVGFKGAVVQSVGSGPWETLDLESGMTFDAAASDGLSFMLGGKANAVVYSDSGVDWTVTSTELSQGIVSLHWLDTMYVAVGQAGGIGITTDAETWTITQVGEPLRAVALHNGELVAVGLIGRTATSTDGITWNIRRWVPGFGPGDLLDIVSDGYLLVAVGPEGIVATSADGRFWTQRERPTAENLNAIAYSGERFVAVGSNGTVIISDNGIEWRRVDTPTDRTLNDVVWTGNKFVAVGSGGVIITSN
jgi:hypothetical protein